MKRSGSPPSGGLRIAQSASDDGMSPSGKAPDFDSGIRRFDPCHPSQFN